MIFIIILELKRCTRLYLNDNNIESLEAVYDKNTILCEIDLSNNAIDRVHPEFTTNLKVRNIRPDYGPVKPDKSSCSRRLQTLICQTTDLHRFQN